MLRTVKARADGPILIHALTEKGKGYAPAETPPTSITAWPSSTSSPARRRRPGNVPSYTGVFGRALTETAARDRPRSSR